MKQQHLDMAHPIISWPGYGIMFFWQLGVLQYLQANFDLSRCTMVGSSAGALLSILSACSVSPQAALDLAHQLCLQHNVYSRPLGLVGIWGSIVREWLQQLLPADAAERCSGGHVQVVVTTLPLLQRQVISSFKDRADLIDVALASAHVPLMLDGQLSAACRGCRCVDGSLLYMITRRCHALKPARGAAPLLLFDPLSDTQLFFKGWQLMRCLLLCGKDGAQQLLAQGAAYAERLDRAGGLQALSGARTASAPSAQGTQQVAQQPPAGTPVPQSSAILGDVARHAEVSDETQEEPGTMAVTNAEDAEDADLVVAEVVTSPRSTSDSAACKGNKHGMGGCCVPTNLAVFAAGVQEAAMVAGSPAVSQSACC